MQAIKKRHWVISKDLNILRAFVDSIKIAKDNYFISAAYRRGRAFCKFDKNFKVQYRVEEESLSNKGFGDFRCFTVNKTGEFILGGQIQPDAVTLFKLNDTTGRIIHSSCIGHFPLLESMDVDPAGNIYLHSPVMDHPLYRFSSDLKTMDPMGEFPDGDSGVVRRIAQVAVDLQGRIALIFETSPLNIHLYSSEGNLLFKKIIKDDNNSIDHITIALDAAFDPDTGNLFILKDEGSHKKRPVLMIDPNGEEAGVFWLPPYTRRIQMGKDGLLIASRTLFGLSGMLLSMGIYGAITVIEEYKIQ